MHRVETINPSKKIILLHWDGSITADEVRQANDEIEEQVRKTGVPFQLIVDTTSMKLTSKDAELAFVEQQKQFLPRISRLAVVNTSNLTKLQLRKMGEQSQNEKENFFNNFKEAVAFLEK